VIQGTCYDHIFQYLSLFHPDNSFPELQKPLLSPCHFINKIISLSDLDFLDKLRFLPPLSQQLTDHLADASSNLTIIDNFVQDCDGYLMVPEDIALQTDIT